MMLLLLSAIEVLQLVAGTEEQQQQMRARYTYREVQENWRLDPYGRRIADSARTKTFDMVMLNGHRYRKLIERNGRPLTPAEAWEVEEDMKRFAPPKLESNFLRDLHKSHQLTVESCVILAQGQSKRHEFTFDPATNVILRQITEGNGTRLKIDYQRLPDGTSMPQRAEVDFTIGDVHGIQISTFSNFTPNWK